MNYLRRRGGIKKARRILKIHNQIWSNFDLLLEDENGKNFKLNIKTRKRCNCYNPRKDGERTRKERINDELFEGYRRKYLAK